MDLLVATAVAVAVTAAVVWPLLAGLRGGEQVEPGGETATLEHEKSVALMAIREADFDRATGKLSEEDHRSLRGQYEERAMHAIEALDGARGRHAASLASAGPAPSMARYCHSCGRGFANDDRFCTSCGTRRAGATSAP